MRPLHHASIIRRNHRLQRDPALSAVEVIRGIERVVFVVAGMAAVVAVVGRRGRKGFGKVETDGGEACCYDCGVVLEHGEEVEADGVDKGVGWVCGGEAEDGEDEGDDGEAEDRDQNVALVCVDLEFSEEGEGDEHYCELC